MTEIDTTSIESVQATISFFGEKDDERKRRSINKDQTHDLDKEKEIETLMKDLANLKAQLEAKDSAHKKDLLKLDHYQKSSDELSTQLKAYEIEKDALRNECQESRTRVREMEATMEKIANQSAECTNLRKQLSSVLRELKDTQGHLLQLDIDLSASKDGEFEAIQKVEVLESSLILEKIKNEELDNANALRESSEKATFDTIVELDNMKGELEQARNEIDEGYERENALQIAIVMLKSEIHKGRSKMASAEAAEERAKMEKSEVYAALQKLTVKAEEAKKVCRIAEMPTVLAEESSDLGYEEAGNNTFSTQITISMDEYEALVEKAERAEKALNPGLENKNSDTWIRNSTAKVEQEETVENPGLEISDQGILVMKAEQAKDALNPGLENPETLTTVSKNEYDILVANAEQAAVTNLNPGQITLSKDEYDALVTKTQHSEKNLNPVLENPNTETLITISKKEHDILLAKAKQAEKGLMPCQDSKKELENATFKIAELRTRAEQAISRAEVAERCRVDLEEQVKKFREHKAKRKAALAALHEASVLKEIAEASSSKGANNAYRYDADSKVYQSLSKMLNMKL